MHRVFSPVAIELFGATCTAAPLPFISGDPWSVRNWDDINESFQRIRVFLRCKRNYGVFERQRCVSPGGVIPLFLMIMSSQYSFRASKVQSAELVGERVPCSLRNETPDAFHCRIGKPWQSLSGEHSCIRLHRDA
jgi:hypothetical protein